MKIFFFNCFRTINNFNMHVSLTSYAMSQASPDNTRQPTKHAYWFRSRISFHQYKLYHYNNCHDNYFGQWPLVIINGITVTMSKKRMGRTSKKNLKGPIGERERERERKGFSQCNIVVDWWMEIWVISLAETRMIHQCIIRTEWKNGIPFLVFQREWTFQISFQDARIVFFYHY